MKHLSCLLKIALSIDERKEQVTFKGPLLIYSKQAPDVNPFEIQGNTDHSENDCFILLMAETLL